MPKIFRTIAACTVLNFFSRFFVNPQVSAPYITTSRMRLKIRGLELEYCSSRNTQSELAVTVSYLRYIYRCLNFPLGPDGCKCTKWIPISLNGVKVNVSFYSGATFRNLDGHMPYTCIVCFWAELKRPWCGSFIAFSETLGSAFGGLFDVFNHLQALRGTHIFAVFYVRRSWQCVFSWTVPYKLWPV